MLCGKRDPGIESVLSFLSSFKENRLLLTKKKEFYMRNLFITTLLLVLISACSGIEENNITYEKLRKAISEGKYMYGHQDDLLYGHSWNANLDPDSEFSRSDVLSTGGGYPAVLGLDFGGIEVGDRENLDGNNFELMRQAAIKHHERGGVITVSWHLRNPLTGGDSWDVTSTNVVASILDGGSLHEKFLGWLDALAEYLIGFKDSKGRQIPIIFRPWHEHTGSWFWWGKGLCSDGEYNALWVMTYNYLVHQKGLDNMVWAISPGASSNGFEEWERRYPGDEYVDILGLDIYEYRGAGESLESANARFIKDMQHCLSSLQKMANDRDKLIAVTETGFESIPDSQWWTGTLAPAVQGFPIAYLLTWRNSDRADNQQHYYTPWPGSRSEADFKAWVDSGDVVLIQ